MLGNLVLFVSSTYSSTYYHSLTHYTIHFPEHKQDMRATQAPGSTIDPLRKLQKQFVSDSTTLTEHTHPTHRQGKGKFRNVVV